MLVVRAVGADSLRGKEWLTSSLGELFGVKVAEGLPLTEIEDAFDRGRRQYSAGLILSKLSTPEMERGVKVLGVATVDLYAPGLNFVFGQADVRWGVAVISLFRLRQEFYGLPSDEGLFRSRALKEAVHEIGHTFGLGHCPDIKCVMHFSNCLADTDLKSTGFCADCRPRLLV